MSVFTQNMKTLLYEDYKKKGRFLHWHKNSLNIYNCHSCVNMYTNRDSLKIINNKNHQNGDIIHNFVFLKTIIS